MTVYKIYGDHKTKGWILYKTIGAKEDIDQVVETMDRKTYRAYMIVERDILKNSDMPIGYSHFDTEISKVRKSR